jgi:hypothetical protein
MSLTSLALYSIIFPALQGPSWKKMKGVGDAAEADVVFSGDAGLGDEGHAALASANARR